MNKVNYVDGVTLITAQNLNEIQETINTLESNKVDKVAGKALSTNDFDDNYKDKVDGIDEDISSAISTHNQSNVAHQDIRDAIVDTQDELENKANIDGYYVTLRSGEADNLAGGVKQVEHFTYQKAGGTADIGSGRAEINSIRGNTLVWNQLIQNGNFESTNGWTTSDGTVEKSAANNILTLNFTANIPEGFQLHPTSSIVSGLVAGHKFFVKCYVKCSKVIGVCRLSALGVINTVSADFVTDKWIECSTIVTTLSSSSSSYSIRLYIYPTGGYESGDILQVKNFTVFDLTQMFGAGYEPSTVEEFKARFPLDYYDFNEGELLNFNGTGLKTVGLNQWKEEWEAGSYDNNTGEKIASQSVIRCKNKIPVFPNKSYYFYVGSSQYPDAFYYDADENFISHANLNPNRTFTTPQNARYMTFRMSIAYGTTYLNDICINLSDAERNGEYEPYWESELALPIATYFPNGMKSAGTVYDELFPNKKVERIGSIDLGTLNWNYATTASHERFISNAISDVKTTISGEFANIVCPKYEATKSDFVYLHRKDKTVAIDGVTIQIYDSSYTDAQSFKTAMSGVYLDYELATPVETPINPPLSFAFQVANNGTMELLPTNTSDPITSPMIAEIQYALNATDTIRNLDKNFQNQSSMDAMLSALGTALGFTWSKAWDSVNKKYTYTITPNS